jgi:hypothetical protein
MTSDELIMIKTICQYPPTSTVAFLRCRPHVKLYTSNLQKIIEHGQMTNHKVLVMFLDILSINNNLAYVDPSFLVSLERSWSQTKTRFSGRKLRAVDRPSLTLDNTIAILLFVNGNHWIASCGRMIHGRVHFYYSDDLNSPRTEARLHHLLRTSTDTEF